MYHPAPGRVDNAIALAHYYPILMREGRSETAKAQGEQVLVSEVVHAVGGLLAGVKLRDVGRKQLKGIRSRQRVYEVVW